MDAPTPSPRRRGRSRRRAPTRQVRRRIRIIYFSLAALWGFLTGSGAVLIGLASTSRHMPLGRPGAATLGGAAILAVLGGVIVSAGYRAASRRFR